MLFIWKLFLRNITSNTKLLYLTTVVTRLYATYVILDPDSSHMIVCHKYILDSVTWLHATSIYLAQSHDYMLQVYTWFSHMIICYKYMLDLYSHKIVCHKNKLDSIIWTRICLTRIVSRLQATSTYLTQSHDNMLQVYSRLVELQNFLPQVDIIIVSSQEIKPIRHKFQPSGNIEIECSLAIPVVQRANKLNLVQWLSLQ